MASVHEAVKTCLQDACLYGDGTHATTHVNGTRRRIHASPAVKCQVPHRVQAMRHCWAGRHATGEEFLSDLEGSCKRIQYYDALLSAFQKLRGNGLSENLLAEHSRPDTRYNMSNVIGCIMGCGRPSGHVGGPPTRSGFHAGFPKHM